LLADEFARDQPSWIIVTVVSGHHTDAFRIGRFVRGLRLASKIAYWGRGVLAAAENAFSSGEADLVVHGDAELAFATLARGVDPGKVPGVRQRQGSTAAAPSAPLRACSRFPLQLFNLGAYRVEPLTSVIPHRVAIGVAASPDRTPQAVADEVYALAGPDRLLHLETADLLENTAWCEAVCEALGANPPSQWFAKCNASSIVRNPDAAARLRSSGCRALVCAATGPEDGPSELEDAAELLRRASLVPLLRPLWLAEGETIGSMQRLALAVQLARRGCPVIGGFSLPPSPCPEDGRLLAADHDQFLPSFPVFLPQSLLADVPPVALASRARDPVETARRRASDIRDWLADGIMLPATIISPESAIEELGTAAARVVEAIDGRCTVGELIAASAEPRWSALRLYAGLALLLLLDGASGERGDQIGTARDPPVVHRYSRFFCARPWTGFEVGEEDGLVRMCCWARDSYGNVNENSIAAIWNGSAIQEMRRKMAAGRYEEICRPECPYIAGWMRDDDPAGIRGLVFGANLRRSQTEINSHALVLESLPRYWKVTHSTLCNLDCIMCYQDRYSKQVLPDSFYDDLTSYYPVMQELLLLGGEPLVTKRIRSLVAEFPTDRAPDAKFALITNGTIYDSSTLALFEDKPMSWVVISIDAAGPATYARIRRGGDLARTLAGVDAWKAFADRKNFPIILSFTVMRDNLRELAEFVSLADRHRVDCQFSTVNGSKADQHLIDLGILYVETQRALDVVAALGGGSRMPIALASLTALSESAP
jgi:MoaA/NifB/PqqE/SkfB family radical SAM enzyme